MARTPHIFLSYSRDDRRIMEPLRDYLRAREIDVWTDEHLTPGTSNWRTAIERNIRETKAMVVLLSRSANQPTSYVHNEVAFALVNRKTIYPVLIDGDETSAIPLSLINHQYVDIRGRMQQTPDEGYHRLAQTLSDQLGIPLQEPTSQINVTIGGDVYGDVNVAGESIIGGDAITEEADAEAERARLEAAELARQEVLERAQQEEIADEHARQQAEEARLEELRRQQEEAEAERIRLEAAAQARQEALELARQAREITAAPPTAALTEQSPDEAHAEVVPQRTQQSSKRLVLLGMAAVAAVGIVIGTLALTGIFGARRPLPLADETAIQLALDGVSANDDWTPVGQVFEDVEMALVPVGCFMMGSEDGSEEEQPVHQQCFDEPFWIDVTEVTNGQYGSSGTFTGDDQPRRSITWLDATAHCESRGARLPTEAEWEYAARGPDGLVYPWGNEWIADNTVWDTEDPLSVGSKPEGASWVGALDMSGNVWEWVSTIWVRDQFPYPYVPDDGREATVLDADHVVRGGSTNSPSHEELRAFTHTSAGRSYCSDCGFRCARDY